MRTWNVSSEGQSWRVDAPDDVTEAEVNAFAAEHADSWKNGGHYAMTEVPPAAAPHVTFSKEDAGVAVKSLDEQMKLIKDNLDQLTTRQYAGPTPALLGGTGREEPGPVTGMAPTPDAAAVITRREQL